MACWLLALGFFTLRHRLVHEFREGKARGKESMKSIYEPNKDLRNVLRKCFVVVYQKVPKIHGVSCWSNAHTIKIVR